MSLESTKFEIDKLWENEYVLVGQLKGTDIGFAKAKREYIPIEDFKAAFTKAADFVSEKRWSRFVFDKSELTVFHQPSMEWYYTSWKKQLIKDGLNQHYKILPEEEFFKSSVEAGIEDIKRNYPDFDFDAFTVEYIDSIDEIEA